MKISITKEHIGRGTPRHPCECPIALALREQWHPEARVGTEHAIRGTVAIRLPLEIRLWQSHFDFGHLDLCKPVVFDLPDPDTHVRADDVG